MDVKHQLKQFGKYLLIERPAKRFRLSGHISNLETSGEKLAVRLSGCKDSLVNRVQIRHLIGIERWTQKRLMVFKGANLKQDEPEVYMPDRDLRWVELEQNFKKNRAETIALIEEIDSDTLAVQTVFHNEFGGMTLTEWVYYLVMQTKKAAKRFE